MKKAVCLPLVFTLLLLSACGSATTRPTVEALHGTDLKNAAVMEKATDMALGFSTSSTQSNAPGSSIYRGENAKLIRSATLRVQTTHFDRSVSDLEQLVHRQGGYFETASLYTGEYESTAVSRSARYTVRIPGDQLDPFLSAVGELVHVAERSVDSKDVGAAYYDTELRLSTLKTKHERLLALMEDATLMEDLIALESALTEVEHEIRQHTSTLERYDSLIDFSTVHIEMHEVVRISETPGQSDTFLARLSASFSRGLTAFADTVGEATLWLAYHFVGLLLFGGILLFLALLLRKLRAGNKRLTPPQEQDDGKKE